jgi:hypothetical protein
MEKNKRNEDWGKGGSLNALRAFSGIFPVGIEESIRDIERKN